VVAQRSGADPDFSGRDNLLLQGRLFGVSAVRKRADELLDRFGLADAADRAVKTYSGGMQRQLGVGCGFTGGRVAVSVGRWCLREVFGRI
jgi:ABC-2 type transport system ATP-binding protein